jgi:acetyl/propionyl-CoA carboxylase alpha subunit
MRYFVTLDDTELTIDVTDEPGGGHSVCVHADPDGDGTTLAAEAQASPGGDWVVRVGDRVFDLVCDGEPPQLTVTGSGCFATLRVESARMRAAASVRKGGADDGDGVVCSPMPGKIVKVLVSEGDEVEVGAPLVVVEAMKMENELTAARAGTVQKVLVQPGDAVEGGARLVMVS